MCSQGDLNHKALFFERVELKFISNVKVVLDKITDKLFFS